jgi:hypothetical protein
MTEVFKGFIYLFKSEFDWFWVVIGHSISYFLSYDKSLVLGSSFQLDEHALKVA